MNPVDKQTALLEADKVTSDEEAAVAFILKCGFADARLRAAEHIHTKASLEKVWHAMRKLDRRVAKLMQARLDAIAKSDLIARQAQECLSQATRLLQENPLMPNRVAELDRAWRSIGEVNDPYRGQFGALRAELDRRLAAQTALQRGLINAFESLKSTRARVEAFSVGQLAERLDSLKQERALLQRSPAFASLPKPLITEFDQELMALSEYYAAIREQGDVEKTKQSLLSQWESLDPAEFNPEEMALQWAALPDSHEDAERAALQERFDKLLNRRSSRPEKNGQPTSPPVSDEHKEMVSLLDQMDHAIQEGKRQEAAAFNEALTRLEKPSQHFPPALASRLTHTRARLKRLEAWARRSANVSREELITSVEDFSAKRMSLNDLAKAIAAVRERWKALDAQSGAAPRALWHRFDAACTKAYVPVAEHSKKQAEARRQNKAQAEALLAEVNRFVEENGLKQAEEAAAAINWKRVAVFYQGMKLSWQRLGHMDRKDRKRLDAAFLELARIFEMPLAARWATEVEKREGFIREVEGIKPEDRKSMDKLRALQQRWQECAKGMPLEHKTEQALWGRFRKACDAVFAQRKSVLAVAEAERKKNAQAKEALIQSLESASQSADDSSQVRLREAAAAWKRIGAAPHTQEPQLEARYRKAVAAMQAQLKKAARQTRQAERETWHAKWTLCCELEKALVSGAADDQAWLARWQPLPSLKGAREALLKKRFDAAIAALGSVEKNQYIDRLQQNRQALEKALLRAEILAGVDSPPEWLLQRRQVQVEILQSSLSGDGGKPLHETLEVICALPALTDPALATRLERLMDKVGWR